MQRQYRVRTFNTRKRRTRGYLFKAANDDAAERQAGWFLANHMSMHPDHIPLELEDKETGRVVRRFAA